MNYDGPVDCILNDGTTLRLEAQLRDEANGGMTGSLALNNSILHLFGGGDPVTLRLINTLPAGMERRFVISGVVTTSRMAFAQLGSIGPWI